jgi:hypothetical protein
MDNIVEVILYKFKTSHNITDDEVFDDNFRKLFSNEILKMYSLSQSEGTQNIGLVQQFG